MDKVASNKIFDELKTRIIEMRYNPGEILNEKALAEEFAVSRTPVREALIKLSQIGLVDIRPRIGTYVSQIDLISVKHAYEIKKNLEGLAAELAAQCASEEEIYELFEILKRFESYDVVKDYKLYIQDDQRFHMIIRSASRNPMLIEILDELNTKTARFLQHIHYILDDYEWFYNSLMKMAEAIRDKDPQRAKETTEEHTNKYLLWLSKNFFM
ncbi:MAG: GntR family transcriptional regulator [Clostridiaceae bacterium]